MTNKINWQDINIPNKNKLRLYLFTGWLKHISKIIFCLLFVFISFYYLVLPQVQVNYFYDNTKCLIAGKELKPLSKEVSHSGFQPKFLVIYQVNQKIYTNWAYDALNNIYTNPNTYKTVANEFKENSYYVCWYDKADPHKVVLKRGWDYISLAFFFITIIIAITSFTSFWRWHRIRHQLATEQATSSK